MPGTNKLYSQVFYNMLISPLQEIKAQINQDIYDGLILQVMSIETKLEVNDWHPFPAYQSLLNKLQIKQKVSQLFGPLINLQAGINVENNKTSILRTLAILESLAHVLNILDVAYTDPKKTAAKVIYNTGKKLGIFGATPSQTYDCNLNLRFSERSNVQTQEIPATSFYDEFITIFNNFSDERLRDICQRLFATMEKVENNDSTAAALKADEQNLFTLGYIERFITLSNAYKELFKAEYEKLNQPAELEESTEICVALDTAFNN